MRAWKGGRSHERWVEEGSPSNPGRLTDLRHIVFKSAATPYRRARRSLGLVLQRGLLKENVDGEALLWAHRRLTSRSELRRILVVVCDGAPSDEATLSSNYEQYLNDHLRTVIKSIETRSIVELMGIGICHDISGLYRCSTSVGRVDDLGPTLMQMVGTALEP
jgi:cobaltochelatase CobT